MAESLATLLLAGRAGGLELLASNAPHLFVPPDRPYLGPDGRDCPGNPQRFAALSWIAARIGAESAGGWPPDILLGHDWQAGLIKEDRRTDPGAPPFRLMIAP